MIPFKDIRWAFTALLAVALCYALAYFLNQKYKRHFGKDGFSQLVALGYFFGGAITIILSGMLQFTEDWSWLKALFLLAITAGTSFILDYIYIIKGHPAIRTHTKKEDA